MHWSIRIYFDFSWCIGAFRFSEGFFSGSIGAIRFTSIFAGALEHSDLLRFSLMHWCIHIFCGIFFSRSIGAIRFTSIFAGALEHSDLLRFSLVHWCIQILCGIFFPGPLVQSDLFQDLLRFSLVHWCIQIFCGIFFSGSIGAIRIISRFSSIFAGALMHSDFLWDFFFRVHWCNKIYFDIAGALEHSDLLRFSLVH